jgi:hypothetical protein
MSQADKEGDPATRTRTLAVALGALVAATAFGAAPALAQADGADARQDFLDARMFNNARAFTSTTA